MTGVAKWTGREIALLRAALRKDGREFAEEVGISQRQLTTWEGRGVTITPQAANQAALDTMLARAGAAAQQRFAAMLTQQAAAEHDERAEQLLRQDPRTMKHPVDGKIMTIIEEGIYLSGPNSTPTWLDAFLIDVYPTTNADYDRFVQATGYPAPRHWPDGRYPEALFDHPVVWVSLHDAMAYARWCRKTLPTTEQWEKAARGPKGYVYPWGSEPTAAKCNTAEAGIGMTTPVTRYQSGVSPYGVVDLCGNVWEWCSTPERPGNGRYELKGSAFTSPFHRATPSLRNAANATMQDNDTGFRCVAPL